MLVMPCCLRGLSEKENLLAVSISLIKMTSIGDNPDRAVLLIHDPVGWAFSNVHLLADHYAQETDVTFYVPDFFGGEALSSEPINKLRWQIGRAHV